MKTELLEVGDKLHTSSWTGCNWFKITRVTKTLAKSKRSDGYEYTFKREISSNMSHPNRRHNQIKYEVERK